MKPDEILAVVGSMAALVAAVSWIAERRRVRRDDLDSIGWMPWTTLFFWTLLAAVIFLGMAAKAWFLD